MIGHPIELQFYTIIFSTQNQKYHAILGGLGVLLGYKAKLADWLLFLFLIPVNFMMHPFWSITDAMQKQMMMTFFLKDLSMTGAALLIAYFGADPVSIDEMLAKRKAAL